MLKIITLGSLLFLLGCQSLGINSKPPSQIRIPVGSTITLNQPLKFQIGYSRSFIQFGKPVQSKELRERYPYCQFYRYEHPDDLETERSLQPDTFTVTRSYRAMDYLQSGSGLNPFTSQGEAGGPPDDNVLGNIMKINSAQQPEIVELKCAVLTEPTLQNYLTTAEIEEVLGSTVTISVK